MRITSAGRVGIGTDTPTVLLEVNSGGGNIPLGLTSTDTTCLISFRDDTTSAAHGNATVGIGAVGDALILRSGEAERMRIDPSGNLKFNSGYGSVATAFGCRAWVKFNGSGTVAINGSGNVTSITDNGTGDYTVNFTTAMPDADYSAQCTANGFIRLSSTDIYASSSLRINTFSNTDARADATTSVAIFR